jgi:hypothetical protein
MEPKFSSPESAPGNVPRPEEGLEGAENGYELPQRSPEQQEQRAPQELPPAPPVAAVQPTAISLPTPVAAVADDTIQTSDDDLPAVAADEDLIEKEWVDKAKKIIADTKDDPHRREQEVGRLQADYLRKRYGKELGAED